MRADTIEEIVITAAHMRHACMFQEAKGKEEINVPS